MSASIIHTVAPTTLRPTIVKSTVQIAAGTSPPVNSLTLSLSLSLAPTLPIAVYLTPHDDVSDVCTHTLTFKYHYTTWRCCSAVCAAPK